MSSGFSPANAFPAPLIVKPAVCIIMYIYCFWRFIWDSVNVHPEMVGFHTKLYIMLKASAAVNESFSNPSYCDT